MAIATSFRASRRMPLLQVVKAVVATIATWLFAGWLIPTPLPVFGAIAALLVVQPSVNQSFGKAIERSVGVILGVLVASALALALGSATWVVLIAIAAAMLIAWALKMTSGTANQVAISAMLVLTLGGTSPEYALDRVIETLIGAVIGIVVNALVVPPVAVAPARRDLRLLGGELAASLDRLADALSRPQRPEDLQRVLLEARLMRPMRDAADASIGAGEESLTLNPRRSAHRQELSDMRALIDRLTPIVTQVIGMTRAVFDHYAPSLAEEPTVHAIAEQLRRAAHDVRLAVHLADVEPNPPTSAVPALTSPLVVAAPRSDHWMVIGSLMEDLRRIRHELVEEQEARGEPRRRSEE